MLKHDIRLGVLFLIQPLWEMDQILANLHVNLTLSPLYLIRQQKRIQ